MASLNDHENRITNIENYKTNKYSLIRKNTTSGSVKYFKIAKMIKDPGSDSCQISFIASIVSDFGIEFPKVDIVSLSTRRSNRIPIVTTLTGADMTKQWFTTDDGSYIWLWYKSSAWSSNISLHILQIENVIDFKQEGYFEVVDTEPNGAIYQGNNSLYTDYIKADKVFNAVWNDYAEFFERGEETEVGDIIALDTSCNEERYIKATDKSTCVVGVHSNSFAHLIGGENPTNGEDFYDYNIKKYIPVGLAGRVMVKVKGPIKKGDIICCSEIAGIGRSVNYRVSKGGFNEGCPIGISLQDKTTDDIGLVKMLITK